MKLCKCDEIISIDGFYKSFNQFYSKPSSFNNSVNQKNNTELNETENNEIKSGEIKDTENNERKSRRIPFAIYPISSQDEDATYYIFGFIISVKMNSIILQESLQFIYENIKEIHKRDNQTPPIVSIDNAGLEVNACDNLGFFYILCRFHLLACWKKYLSRIKKNNLTEIKKQIEYLDKSKKLFPVDSKKMLNNFLNEWSIYENEYYNINFDYKKNKIKKKKKKILILQI